MFNIEVAYANQNTQKTVILLVKNGTTVLEAITQSRILEFFPEIAHLKNRVGIYGKQVKLEQILNANDRIEIYRDLYQDPKEARRNRVKSQRHKK